MSRRDDRDDDDRPRRRERDGGYREERAPRRDDDAYEDRERGRARPPADDYDDDRGRGRSRDDDDDRGRRRSRSRDDYDDRDDRPRRRPGSGLVTAIGIITIIYGSLALIGGFCNIFGGVATLDFFGAADILPGFRVVRIMAIIQGILGLAAGGMGISGGIGVLQRRQWGRTLTVITIFCGLAIFVLNLVAMIFILRWNIPGGTGTIVVQTIFGALINVGFAVFAMIVLFNAKTAREFK